LDLTFFQPKDDQRDAITSLRSKRISQTFFSRQTFQDVSPVSRKTLNQGRKESIAHPKDETNAKSPGNYVTPEIEI
jgi:hypothetical protein